MEPKTRILVVDDNADLCASLRLVLKHSGFQVETASSGPTALRMVRASPPDVVILDANMRPVSGFETLAQIRAESNVPIIFYGPEFKPGRYSQFVRTVDIAPTLAAAAGVKPTEKLDGVTLTAALK